jgi:hypothetical protein
MTARRRWKSTPKAICPALIGRTVAELSRAGDCFDIEWFRLPDLKRAKVRIGDSPEFGGKPALMRRSRCERGEVWLTEVNVPEIGSACLQRRVGIVAD